jgi:hypothetical protein
LLPTAAAIVAAGGDRAERYQERMGIASELGMDLAEGGIADVTARASAVLGVSARDAEGVCGVLAGNLEFFKGGAGVVGVMERPRQQDGSVVSLREMLGWDSDGKRDFAKLREFEAQLDRVSEQWMNRRRRDADEIARAKRLEERAEKKRASEGGSGAGGEGKSGAVVWSAPPTVAS